MFWVLNSGLLDFGVVGEFVISVVKLLLNI